MAELYSNFAESTLASGISNSATSVTVASGAGSKFPNPTGSDYFIGFLVSADRLTTECVKVTARSSDTMTIVRAQQGSSASAFSAGAVFRHGANKDALTRYEAIVSKYSLRDPFAPDPTATTSYEFTTSDLSAFTKIYITGEANVTVDAATTLPKGVFMEMPSQQYRMRTLLLAHPNDTNWTIHSAVGHSFLRPDDTNIATAGILLSDGNTAGAGNQHNCTLSTHSGMGWTRLTWSGFGNTATGAAAATLINYERFAFLRVRKQAGTYYMGWSSDGQVWFDGTFTPGFTISHFGIYGQNYTTFDKGQCWFPYLRYYNNGTQYYTGSVRTELSNI